MAIEVVRITESRAEGFRACLDAGAREKKFLARTEAPSLDRIEDVDFPVSATQGVMLDNVGQTATLCPTSSY